MNAATWNFGEGMDPALLRGESPALVSAALELAASGYPVFALRADKKPATAHGFKDAMRDPAVIRRMFAQPGAALIGIPTGPASGLLVVDIDPNGRAWLQANAHRLTATRTHSTRRGQHFVFKYPCDREVRNSAGKLAPGVDVRGEGGYIVWWPAAGLAVENAETIADAPSWLLDALAEPPSREPLPAPAAAEPFAEGSRNDSLTREAGKLRRVGLNEDEIAAALLAMNTGRCSPPLPEREVRAIAKSIGKKPAGPPDANGVAAPESFEVLTVREMLEHAPREDIVEGVLPDADLVMLFGESGSGKSFLALDLLVAIALGQPWRDRHVLQRRCLYVAAEGRYGVRNRLEAAMRVRDFDPEATPLRVMPRTPNLLLDEQTELVIHAIDAHGGFDVVAFDTLAQVMAGGNENAGEDMGAVLGACRRIREATGAMVLLVHHAGKDTARGARGWSGMHAAMDAVIEVNRSGAARTATVVKQKDGADGVSFPFTLEVVDLGVTPRGRAVSSCVVRHEAEGPRRVRTPQGKTERVVLRAVQDAVALADHADVGAVIDAAVRGMPFDEAAGKKDQRRRDARRALQSLQAGGFIEMNDNTVSLT